MAEGSAALLKRMVTLHSSDSTVMKRLITHMGSIISM